MDAEIVITASPLGQRADEMATPVITIVDDELVHRRQATLGETLSGRPGINFENFGGGAGRPVIRGQSAPRVQTMIDSANVQDASFVSPDHAVNAEPLLLRGIEVLRGPATLLYGGGAIGGAVNLLDDKVPTALPAGGIAGVAEARLGTADDERSVVGGLTVGLGPFAFRAEGVYRDTGDYRVPDGFGEKRVRGSFNDTNTVSLGASWIGEGGYLGFAYTRQRSEYGLPGHSHDHAECHPHSVTLHCGGHNHDHDHGHHNGHETHDVPFVNLRSDRFDIRSEYQDPMPGLEKMRFRMSFTDYEHDEIEADEVLTTFANKAYDIRLELNHAPVGSLRGVIGVQHGEVQFSSTGQEQYLPPSETRRTALFAMETVDLGALRVEVAVRQEWQTLETAAGGRAQYRPFSVSGAAIWDVDGDYSVALALARSQRAPNVQELYSNSAGPWQGVHLATNSWEIGTPTLGKETQHSVDLTFRKIKGPLTFTIGVYHQDFRDYIFASVIDQVEDFRLVRYTAADATFTGIDGEIRQQITPDLAVSAFGDFVHARLKGNGGNLPRIPTGRLGARLDGDWGPLSADIEYYRVFAQRRFADFETRTPGYNMVNTTLAYHLTLGGGINAELFIRGTNLTNSLSYSHASFIKNASPLRGRNILIGARAAF